MTLRQKITLFLGLSFSVLTLAMHGNNQQSLAPMLTKTMPAVVNIDASGKIDLSKDPLLKQQLSSNLSQQQLKKLSNLVFDKIGSGKRNLPEPSLGDGS